MGLIVVVVVSCACVCHKRSIVLVLACVAISHRLLNSYGTVWRMPGAYDGWLLVVGC